MPDYGNVSPRQTTKADVLYVPGVNLQLITQERDHKDPSQITAPHMTFGRTVCKTAVIFCQVNALFIAQLSCHVFDSGVCMHASRQRQRGSSDRQPSLRYTAARAWEGQATVCRRRQGQVRAAQPCPPARPSPLAHLSPS